MYRFKKKKIVKSVGEQKAMQANEGAVGEYFVDEKRLSPPPH